MDQKWLFLCCICCLLFYKVASKYDNRCITPNDERAKCIPIYRCKVFLNAVKSGASKSQKKYIRESLCGLFRNTAVVCCGKHSDYLPGKKRNRRDAPSPPAPVTFNSECGLSRTDDRPSGGRITQNGEFPWSARLHYSNSKTVPCEGTLINKRYVITSGLCLSNRSLKRAGPLVKINLGEHNCRRHEHCEDKHIEVGIEEIILHPNFTSKGIVTENDIGLLRLDKDVLFNEHIRPICLPQPNEAANVGDWVTETGWSKLSRHKLKSDLCVVSIENCIKAYSDKGVKLKNIQLCAGGDIEESCVALSGGSLMTRRNSTPTTWYLEGIVSLGPKQCAIDGLPNIYTKVVLYLDWIHSKVKM